MSLAPVLPTRRAILPAVVASLAVLATAGSARAEYIIDLTKSGSSGTAQGALYFQADPQPTGTGYIDPFVRIQRTGTESGYNTDGQIEFDTKDEGGHNWTHSLTLNSLSPVTINGTQYYEFGLDINEAGSDRGRLLSMNDLQVYLGNSPSLTGFTDGSGFGADSVKVYDLDVGVNGEARVELDYRLNSGSGSGDMFVYIPVSAFQGFGSEYQYVYLYSAFGQPNGSDAGFEEWWARVGDQPPTGVIPAPPGLLLGLIGIGGCLFGRTFRRRTAAAVTPA